MTKPKVTEYNALTNETLEREMTDSEFAQWQEEYANQLAKEAKLKIETETLWKIKVAAYEKLSLTNEEIEAIAPTPDWLKPQK